MIQKFVMVFMCKDNNKLVDHLKKANTIINNTLSHHETNFGYILKKLFYYYK